MKKRQIFFAFLLSFALLKIPKHYARWTGGFRLASCDTHLTNRSEWASDTPSEEIRKILSQPFSFYRRGTQAYAFLSQDGQYVLKIFSQPLKKYRFPPKLYPYRAPLSQASYQKQIEEGIMGYCLASKLPPQMTGLLYAHLNTTEKELPFLNIRDAWLRSYQLPLDRVRFVLQRKCQMLAPTLKQAIQTAPKEAKRLAESFHKAIATRAAGAIRNSDTEFKKNFGILDGEVIEFDCGAYSYDPSLEDPSEQMAEVEKFSAQLRYWVKKYEGQL